jgi:hypothetical protein
MLKVYTKLADDVRAIKKEYKQDINAIARALSELRGNCMYLFLVAAAGWGLFIWKCLS